jgi:hypothetical protein
MVYQLFYKKKPIFKLTVEYSDNVVLVNQDWRLLQLTSALFLYFLPKKIIFSRMCLQKQMSGLSVSMPTAQAFD